MIDLLIQSRAEDCTVPFLPRTLIIAGWTGRDAAALEAHIVELEVLGIARPKAVPMFYRVDAALLTCAPVVQVVGREASGEIESVLWKHQGELYVGIGSDHTDRKLEAYGITLSKQVCAKPVSAAVWPWLEVADHWDRMLLRSRLPPTDEIYQQGSTAGLRRPDELLGLYESREGTTPDGTVMFCGTLPVQGGIRFTPAMTLELHDAVLERSLQHRYAVEVLPVAES
jgi:Protein of unknown function (DUF2848)